MRIVLSPKMAAIYKQLRIPNQWQIDQLMKQQINNALQSNEDDHDIQSIRHKFRCVASNIFNVQLSANQE